MKTKTVNKERTSRNNYLMTTINEGNHSMITDAAKLHGPQPQRPVGACAD